MMVAPGRLSAITTGASRARAESLVDRRAHLGRKIRGIDDVLDPDRDAAQRPGVLRARDFRVMADKGADGFFLRADRLQRLGDGGIGGKIALRDAALKVGERDHGHRSLRRTTVLRSGPERSKPHAGDWHGSR